MQYRTKVFILLQFIILFVFIGQRSFAQYPGMGAVYRNMNNQFMTQQMNTSMQMTMMGRRGLSKNAISDKYIFYVIMKDGTKKFVNSKIYTDTSLHKDYLVEENKSLPKSDTNRKRKIFSCQTQNISHYAETELVGEPDRMTGISTDSCWIFKVVTGKINIYSYLSETNESQYFSPASFIGLQYDNGEIVKFTEENLKKMLSDDDEAMQMFLKKNYYFAIVKYNKNIEKVKKK